MSTWAELDTDARIKAIRARSDEGMSSSQIARELGAPTRNAIIGYWHRYDEARGPGVVRRGGVPKSKKTKAPVIKQLSAQKPEQQGGTGRERQQVGAKRSGEEFHIARRARTVRRKALLGPTAEDKATERAAQAAADDGPAPPGAVRLLDLEPHHCRWPIGDVRSTGFHFCGEMRAGVPHLPYCAKHVRLAIRRQETQ